MSARNNKVYLFFLILVLFIGAIVVGTSLFNKRPSLPTVSEGEQTPGIEELQERLVANFPQIPVYPNATLVSSYKKHDNTKVGFEATWQTPDNVSDVSKWYAEQLPLTHWVIVEPSENLNAEGEQFMIAKRGEFDLYLIVENEDGDITSVHAEFPIR